MLFDTPTVQILGMCVCSRLPDRDKSNEDQHLAAQIVSFGGALLHGWSYFWYRSPTQIPPKSHLNPSQLSMEFPNIPFIYFL